MVERHLLMGSIIQFSPEMLPAKSRTRIAVKVPKDSVVTCNENVLHAEDASDKTCRGGRDYFSV